MVRIISANHIDGTILKDAKIFEFSESFEFDRKIYLKLLI